MGDGNVNIDHLDSGSQPAGRIMETDGAEGFRYIATPSGGGGGGTELTQAMVEDETDTTFGTVSGQRLAQALAVFAPGGSASTDRIVLADAVGVSNTAGPHEITLTEAMVARQIVTFHVVTSGASNPDAIGYFLSDDILALTAEATAPSDSENGLSFTTTNYTQTSITSQGGNYFVFRKDDSTLWIRPTRLLAHSLTITATPLGGAASTQAAGSAGRTLTQRNIITARTPLAEFSFTTDWALVSGTAPTFTAIPKADFDRIELGFYVNSAFVYPIVLTRAMVTEMGPTPDPLTAGLVDSSIVTGALLTFRTATGPDAREPVLLSPKYGFMQARSAASRCGILVHMNDDSSNDWAAVGVHVVCNDQVDWEYARVYFYEDN